MGKAKSSSGAAAAVSTSAGAGATNGDADKHPARGSRADRRRSGRVPVSIPVEEHTDEGVYFQQATNLSLGGLFLHGTLPHAAGTAVRLHLSLPGRAEPLPVDGVVVPTLGRGRGMGVRFQGLREPARQEILRAIRR